MNLIHSDVLHDEMSESGGKFFITSFGHLYFHYVRSLKKILEVYAMHYLKNAVKLLWSQGLSD